MSSPKGFEALLFWNDGLPSFTESAEHHRYALTSAFVTTNG
jgi:hypothetical protein